MSRRPSFCVLAAFVALLSGPLPAFAASSPVLAKSIAADGGVHPAAGLELNDTDASIIYSSPNATVGSAWVYGTGGGVDFDNDEHNNNFCAVNPPQATPVLGPMAVINFTGTSVTWVGKKGPNFGIAAVAIDGGATTNVDNYNATTLAQQQLFTFSGLSNSSHTMSIQVTCTKNSSSTDFYQVVDAFIIGGSGAAGLAFSSGSQGRWNNSTFNTPLTSCGNSLDADIRSYFDTVNQTVNQVWLIRFLKHWINDSRMIHLIKKWLRAGIPEDGIVTQCSGNPDWALLASGSNTNLNSTGQHVWSGAANNTMTWTFTGSLIEIFTRPDTGGGFFNVTIDGTPVATNILDYYNTVDNDAMTGYMSYAAKLGSGGSHTIVLTTTGVNNPFGGHESGGQTALVQVDMFLAFP